PETRRLAGPYDAEALTHPWRSPHSGVDELHAALSALVEARGTEDATAVFPEVHAVVARAAAELGLRGPTPIPLDTGLRPPRLSEPWFCCAEPTRAQLDVF
ncbi:MAG TPA: hypothetical protein VGR90_02680, partial [Acidimicrobiales bacterium]|nr:hypothetical protein [Acidimicrobiales bacterium]